MPFYVYVLQSEKDGSFYKGFTENPIRRLRQHNGGEMRYTAGKGPWGLVCLLELGTKTEALIKERKLKKYGSASLEALINSGQNILKDFLKNQ